MKCEECRVYLKTGSLCDKCIVKWREVNRFCPTCRGFAWLLVPVDIHKCPDHGPCERTTCAEPGCQGAKKDKTEDRFVGCERCTNGRLSSSEWEEAKKSGEMGGPP